MAVDLSTSPGGLFRRLGKAGAVLNSLISYLGNGDISSGGLKSLGVSVDALQDQFEASRQDLTAGLYALRDSFRVSQSSLPQFIKTQAQNTVVEMVNDDTKLSQKTLALALAELVSQMISGSASVPRPTVSASATAGGSNTGTGVCAVSVLGADGVQLDYVPAESIVIKATNDAQAGLATAGSEPFSFTGALAQTDPLRWDYPLGSGCSGSLSAVDASLNNSTNVLQNSSFATYTNANAPDNWPVAVGSVGTAVLQATGSNAYKGTSGLALVGDGSVLHALNQPFNTTPATTLGGGGTSYRILPSTVYALSVWHKVSNNAATGVLTFSLTDGTSVLTDAATTANTISVTVDNLTTSWSNTTGFFRTPAVLPTQAKLRIALTTALSNTHTLYIDHLALTPATALYTGGPYVAVFSGATEFVRNDKFTVAVANDWVTNAKWAVLLERLFGLKSLGVRIPSSGSPTIADSWIA